MKQLTCEMCGSTDIVKQDGLFICKTCGTKYSVEEAKKMMIEGTVEVKGTVSISREQELNALLDRAYAQLEDGDFKEAINNFNKILDLNNKCSEAHLGLLMAKHRIRKIELFIRVCPFDWTAEKEYINAKKYANQKVKDILDKVEVKYPIVESVTLSGDGRKLLGITDKEIETLVIPDGVTEITSNAIVGCSKLKKVQIPASVQKIGMNFIRCPLLEIVECESKTIETGDWGWGNTADSIKYIKGPVDFVNCLVCEKTEKIVVTGGDKFKLKIGKAKNLLDIKLHETYGGTAIYSGSILLLESKNIEIPEGVKSIEEKAFACTDIESIVIPSSVTFIGKGAFFCCRKLKTVIINGTIRDIKEETFYECKSLEKVVLPKTLECINRGAFYGCSKLYLKLHNGVSSWLRDDGILGFHFEEEKSDQQAKGCYVATCVYGSYDCPEVWTLRRYRDQTLGSTRRGRAFIKLYYAISPKLVKLFGKTKWFKKMWKGKLDRMVKKLNDNGVGNTPYNDKDWN